MNFESPNSEREPIFMASIFISIVIAILGIYRFDAIFDTESELPEKWKHSIACLGLSLSILGIFAKQMFQKAENNLVELIRYQTWCQTGKWPK